MQKNQNSITPGSHTETELNNIARLPHNILAFIGESVCDIFSEGRGISLENLLYEYKNRLIYLNENIPGGRYKIIQINAAIEHLNTLAKKRSG